MLVSFIFPDNLFIQCIVFVLSSSLLIFLTKPFVAKLTKKDKTIVTNAYSIIGKNGIVTKDISPNDGVGQIKIAGETWSAKTIDNTKIEKGAQIEVTNIDGVKAVVTRN